MSITRSKVCSLLITLVSSVLMSQHCFGSDYQITSHSVACGGGTIAGPSFEMAATIGQIDAGTDLSGGSYMIAGGFWPVASHPDNCPADISNDGNVNVSDLLAVIGAWGACPTPCPPQCPADIAPVAGGDCVVNVSDLLGVIGSWGACP